MTNAISSTFPPSFSISFAAAIAVPEVATKSSTRSIFCPSFIASLCISTLSFPYSSSYSSLSTSDGSFPGFLIGMNPLFNLCASMLPTMNPLLSIPAIASMSLFLYLFSIMFITLWIPWLSLRSVVMSLNMTPGFGQFGIVLILLFMKFSSSSPIFFTVSFKIVFTFSEFVLNIFMISSQLTGGSSVFQQS